MQKRGRRFGLLLGLLTVAVVAAIVGASNATSSSTAIHGRMLNIQNFPCQSATGVCSSFTATGSIKGTGTVFIDTFPTPYPTPQSRSLVSAAHTIIETKKGNLTCSELAVFDAPRVDHPFVDLCMITGGTGIYARATGYIQESGTFDFASNVGQLEYIGKLELARN